MNGMYPFKKRYLLIIIPIIIIVVGCIYRTDAKYEDVVEYKISIGEEFSYGEATVSVNSVKLVDRGYIEEEFVDNPMLLSVYDNVYNEKRLVMVTIDVVGIDKDIFRNMINSWRLVAGVDGSGTSLISDFASGEFTEEKEDREITFFFKVEDEWLEKSDNQIVIMSDLYPVQHNIYVDLSE